MAGKPLKNLKHERFSWEYLKDLNPTNAAIRTGYSVKSAHVGACNLLKRPNIRARVQELIAEKAGEAGVNAEWIIVKLKTLVERCMQPEPVMVWDYDIGQLVQKKNDVGELVFEFDSNGANKALELLGKHVGLFEKDNLQKQAVINVNILNIGGPNNTAGTEQPKITTTETGGNDQHSIGSVFEMLPAPTPVDS